MKSSTIASTLALLGVASAASQSICDKYTTALLKNNTAANQLTLVTLLVKTAALGNFTGGSLNPSLPGSMVEVPGILAPGTVDGTKVNLVPYFSGALASTNVNGKAEAVDWLDNGSVKDLQSNVTSAGTPGTHGYTLFNHLIEYFGVLLGCSEVGKGSFPAYGGSNDMAAVHQYMVLSDAEFTWFVDNVGLAAASFGVSKSDINTVATALNSLFGKRCSAPAMIVPDTPKLPQAICQGSTCPMASPADCAAYPMESMPASATATMSAPASLMPATYSPSMNVSSAMTSSAMTSSAMTSSAMTSSAMTVPVTGTGSMTMPVASTMMSSPSVPVATGGASMVKAAGAVLAAAPFAAMLL